MAESNQRDEIESNQRDEILKELREQLISGYRLSTGDRREMSELQSDFMHEAIEGLSLLEAIPTRMFGAALRYIVEGIKPGHFLSAVITNDLRDAIARADEENQAALVEWVQFFYNYTPGYCWGSTSNMKNWINNGLELRGRR